MKILRLKFNKFHKKFPVPEECAMTGIPYIF